MSHPSPDDEREWLELSTGVQPVTTPRAPSSGPPAAPVPHLTNGVPIPDRPPLRAGDHATIAADLVSHELEGAVFSEERFWKYDGVTGVWSELHDRTVGRTVQAYSCRPYQNGKGIKDLVIDASDVAGTVACAKGLLDRPDWFHHSSPGVGFKNGFLGIVAGAIGLRDPSAEHRLRAAHPFSWDPLAPRAELDQFFDELFASESEEEKTAKIWLLQEFFGASMLGIATDYEKCLVLYGKGGEGKSQILELLRAVIPDKKLVCCVPPHKWGDRFQVEQMVGCLANVVDEIPESEIVAGATFKGIITGEPVDAERKFQDAFNFRPRAAHVFSCNQLPSTQDLSKGFFDRFMLLPLTRVIRGTAVARPKAARHVIASCLPGLVSWSVEGAARLVAAGHYTVPVSSGSLFAQWRRECDNVAIFLEENCRRADIDRPIGLGNGTKATRLYVAYVDWCKRSGFRPGSIKTFARRSEACGLPPDHTRDGNYYPVWPLTDASPEGE